MGSPAVQSETNFSIKRENFPQALDALKKKYVGFLGGFEHLEEAVMLFNWQLQINETTGDAVGIWFLEASIDGDEEFFALIAKFVEPGSFIVMYGCEADVWRWFFDGVLHNQTGQVVFQPLPFAVGAKDN